MYDLVKIDWNLGNQCNLRCSYCHWELHNGENLFPNLDKLSPAFDHLIDQCRAFSQIQIEFSGGEPTSSEAVQHIISSKTNSNIVFNLHSNGTAPYTWWESVKNNLAQVTLTYHLTQDLNHFINVVKLLATTEVKIYIATLPETWESARHAYSVLKELNSNTDIQLLYKNFIRGNSIYYEYDYEQWKEYYKTHNIDISNSAEVRQTVEFKRANNLNNFYGHMCHAGVNQIVVDNFGDVWRGWCKANLCLGNVFLGNVKLETNPKPCPKRQCRNSFDLQAHKSQGSWGIA